MIKILPGGAGAFETGLGVVSESREGRKHGRKQPTRHLTLSQMLYLRIVY